MQHLGSHGVTMYENGKLANYQFGIRELEAAYPTLKCADVINAAVVILP
jgi:hypothetical protein